jgi:hypothetical protein
MTDQPTKSARARRRPPVATRAELMEEHAAARQRRIRAPLGGSEYSAAAEEIARLEVAIAELEERAAAQPKGQTA